MIKKILIGLVFIVFMLTNINTVYGSESEHKTKEIQESTSIDVKDIEDFSQKIQNEQNYIPEFSIKGVIETYKETGSIGFTLKDMANTFIKFIFKEVVENSRLLIELLVLGILSAILQNIQSAFSENGIGKIANYACFCTIVVIIIKSFTLVMDLATTTIDKMVDFSAIIIPPLIMLIATTGEVVTAAALDPITIGVITVSSTVIKNFILPLTIFVVALNIVNGLSEEQKVQKLASFIRQVSLWALGLIMTIFITIITVRSNMTANLDVVTLKTTKFFVDNFIPLVGRSLSDAITTVVGYSLVLKDALSLIGLIIIVFICIFPLIKIVLISLIYKFVGAVMEPIVDKRITNCLSSVGSSFTIIFASLLSVSVMFFIMITIISSTGKLIMTVG